MTTSNRHFSYRETTLLNLLGALLNLSRKTQNIHKGIDRVELLTGKE